MKAISNILVGVDLSDGDRLVGDAPVRVSQSAIEKGLLLAERTRARTVFITILEVSQRARHALEESEAAELVAKSREVLMPYLDRAKEINIASDVIVGCGKPSDEMIERVLTDQCDLLIVGASQVSRMERLIFGSTAMRVLRHCPCPVWAVATQEFERDMSVLVATDLTDASDSVVAWGARMADTLAAPLRLLHIVEQSDADPVAIQAAREQIEQQATTVSGPSSTIEVVSGDPDDEIRRVVNQHNVGLLVMGTVARSGIAGILIGNTAERLMETTTCSLLVVRPPGFHSRGTDAHF